MTLAKIFEQPSITRCAARPFLLKLHNELGKVRASFFLSNLFTLLAKSKLHTSAHPPPPLVSPPLFFKATREQAKFTLRVLASRRLESLVNLRHDKGRKKHSDPPDSARSPATPYLPADSSMNGTVRSIKQLPEG